MVFSDRDTFPCIVATAARTGPKACSAEPSLLAIVKARSYLFSKRWLYYKGSEPRGVLFDKEGFKLTRPERLQHLTMMVMNTDETRINRVARDERAK